MLVARNRQNLRRMLTCFLAIVATCAPAFATTYSRSLAGGTLSWTSTTTSSYVEPNTTWVTTLSNFQFIYGGTTTSISGSVSKRWICSGVPTCSSGASIPYGLSLPIDSTTSANATITTANLVTLSGYSVSGYISPKYKVVGVYYVVPGAGSSMAYCNSTSIGSNDSITSSFTAESQTQYAVTTSASIFGFLNGTKTATYSNSYKQSSSTSSTVAISTSSTNCLTIPGASNSYVPNNHDYDLIAVWLNPLMLLTYTLDANKNITAIRWNGYGYDAQYGNAMNIQYIYAGCLNGDFADSACTGNLAPLSRSWDTSNVWADGVTAGLTSADKDSILSYDPFGRCTSLANISPSSYPANNCTIAIDPSRYTLTNSVIVPYYQPVPGGQPVTDSYSFSYSVANTQSSSNDLSKSQTFGLSYSFGSTLFNKVSIAQSIEHSNTITTDTSTSKSLTSTNSQTYTASITGPPCSTSGSSCNPIYPSTSYPGPTSFYIYEDTIFGTYLFVPTNWYY